jgi:hypothetical protein
MVAWLMKTSNTESNGSLHPSTEVNLFYLSDLEQFTYEYLAGSDTVSVYELF